MCLTTLRGFSLTQNTQFLELIWPFKSKWVSFKKQTSFKNSPTSSFCKSHQHMATLFSLSALASWCLIHAEQKIQRFLQCKDLDWLLNPGDILGCSDCYQRPRWWGTHCLVWSSQMPWTSKFLINLEIWLLFGNVLKLNFCILLEQFLKVFT